LSEDLSGLLARPHVLLDFDGPVCAVYGGTSSQVVAGHLRDRLRAGGAAVPPDIADTDDPLDVLRYASTVGRECLSRIESAFVELEVAAVATATPTPGAPEAMSALVAAGRSITIVSNNSAESVWAYLKRADLPGLIVGVAGRVPRCPDLMKPHPHLLWRATVELGTTAVECVMIGDSETDIEVAHLVGSPAVAFAHKPSKRARLEAPPRRSSRPCSTSRPPCPDHRSWVGERAHRVPSGAWLSVGRPTPTLGRPPDRAEVHRPRTAPATSGTGEQLTSLELGTASRL
jgi:beta-phosphoglucomutase-like phosphatase (HAD superfamily)